ncbi:hypothetical protein THAOC_10318 [Thalassiosira oceanica]|uniref:Uncharacterized protein n=1 Tax=Thalassiosira oceanica TaxID=159749 RepID=K0TD98_THAOC|nr:hypothetical protein THAOC_10318 [Thalassiosira oceanica]|eukprot:EJK68492.1 hypothetical protein THAOC_10318 [Thalassiosira oceanica]
MVRHQAKNVGWAGWVGRQSRKAENSSVVLGRLEVQKIKVRQGVALVHWDHLVWDQMVLTGGDHASRIVSHEGRGLNIALAPAARSERAETSSGRKPSDGPMERTVSRKVVTFIELIANLRNHATYAVSSTATVATV